MKKFYILEIRPPDKSVYLNLISQTKHIMLSVLEGTMSVRLFF